MTAELSPVKRALLEIRELRARVATLEARHAIAVVGMGLRMPGGATDAAGMAHLLWTGGDAIGPIPSDRWDMHSFYDPDPDAAGRMITREGGFLGDIDRFDADFFGISTREAASMDPQQRLLLEVCWHALEDAGYANAALDGSRTGVYMGVSNSDYARAVWQRPELIDAYCASGSAFSVLAGRVSYCLGLRGPSLAVDTACSSSLVALHLAARALRTGECTTALAGGINLILSPEFNIAFTKARMMAPDGRCKSFDAAADGYVRGEGVGVLVLKRLTDALAADDRILAVMHGSAVNQDGSSNGLTAPNGPAQEAVIRAALSDGGIAAGDVSYVEAHGTGTPLGDPIEMGALAAVFAGGRERAAPLRVGSVKTNLGHLEAAAGVAGVIKVILSLQRRAIPPNLHFNTGNPRIDWEALPIEVPRVATTWPAGSRGRLAGVSSFGFSGTNAHVVLGEAPAPGAAPPRPAPLAGTFVLPLSARDEAGLREQAARYARWLDDDAFSEASALADACFTAGVGRRHFRHRLTASGASAEALRSGLAAFAAGADGAPAVTHARTAAGTAPKVAFLFGAECLPAPDLVRELSENAPVFRRVLDDCANILQPQFDLHAQLRNASPVTEPRRWRLVRFAVDHALAALWQSWGVEPDSVASHGVGDSGAACFTGVLTLEEGLALAAAGEPGSADFRALQARLARRPSRWTLLSPAPRSEALEALRARGAMHVIEIGRQSLPAMLALLQQLYVEGAPVDWQGLALGHGRRRVALPLYPFRRRRHWIDPPMSPPAPWARVASVLDRQSDQGPVDLNIAAYPAIWSTLERLTLGHVMTVLCQAGLFAATGETRSVDDVLTVAVIGADHRRLIHRWLNRLSAQGLLSREGGAFVARAPLPTPDLAALWADADRGLAGNPQLLAYLKNCGALLPRVLRGAVSPLETLFPGGSFTLARDLYEHSATMRYINTLAASALDAYVRALGRPARVMEVGGGSGATTASLLPMLDRSASYFFTDVSALFLDQARSRFGTPAWTPTLTFGLFDMDRDPAGQGFEDATFDLIVSANAVHASADLPLALSRLRRLLRPGGALMLVESTTDFAWFDMSTGLIEGWQHFTDPSRRDQPLLSAPQWLEALAAAGFSSPGAWPAAGSQAAVLGQHVLIGQAAGMSTAAATGTRSADAPLAAALPPAAGVPPAADAARGDQAEAGFGASAQLRERLAAALPDERGDLLREIVRRHVMQVLRRAADEPPGLQDRLMDLGIDSLMAVQLRGQLGRELGLSQILPATLTFDHPSIAALAHALAGYLSIAVRPASLPHADAAPAGAPAAAPAAALADAPEVRTRSAGSVRPEPIAIIGLGCRVPGADTPAGFWDLLRDGRDTLSRVPPDRWNHADYFGCDAAEPGRIATHSAGFLSHVDRFDPGFFGISAREANAMDPQQRLLLEVSWEALEHAGIAPDSQGGAAVGVYIGATSTDYAYLQIASDDRALLDGHYASGVAHSVLSGRLSYLLGLQGPSLTVDTACSSSLVAVHLACQGLRNGDCRMALAGGVNLILSPALFVALSRAHMLAPDGRCKTFDAAADGFARGEGCGVVALKRHSDALADGDRVLALIRGSAVNQDGPSSSLSAPNGPAQAAVIRRALDHAGLEPRQVGYIEAHGTGTQLGDPLEMGALGAVFDAPRAAPLLVGSVKTNIGHLEGAAGIAGLIKLVLALQHRTIPAHLHLRTPSPHIPWDQLPMRVPVTETPWPAIDGRHIAGVSAFGFSGTNAHVVVEAAATETLPVRIQDRPFVIALSARSRAALAELGRRACDTVGDAPLADVCRSFNAGRAQFEWRATISADSSAGLRAGLAALAQGATHGSLRAGRVAHRDPPRIAFLFTGQGAQHAGMARGLYDSCAVFRSALDECAALAAPELSRPLLDVMFNDATALDRTEYTQPALFAIEYALFRLWDACGVKPAIVLGHSVGEFVAACVAGVFGLEDGMRLICRRARLMQSLPAGGSMAAVAAPQEALEGLLGPGVCVAAVNGPAQTVIAGEEAAVQAACAQLAARGIHCVTLPVSHAFHSHRVEPVLDAFEEAARGVTFAAPQLRMISNLTGALVAPDLVTRPEYWRRHLREPVRFAAGVRALAAIAPDICIEIGPHPVLLAFVSASGLMDTRPLVPSLRRGHVDWAQFQEGLATVFLLGARINWSPTCEGGRVIDLPTYPFERQRYWFRTAAGDALPAAGTGELDPRSAEHPLLGKPMSLAVAGRFHQSHLTADRPAFLRDHVALGRVVLPATAYLEMLLAAADTPGEETSGSEGWFIEEVTIGDAMLMPERGGRIVQTVVDPADSDVRLRRVAISSRLDHAGGAAQDWTLHVTARLRRGAILDMDASGSLAAARGVCTEAQPVAAFYANLAERGMAFGPAFQGVTALWRGTGEHANQSLGEVTLPEECAEARLYRIHPALLDGCLQVMAASLTTEADALFLPIAIGAVRVFGAIPRHCWSHVTIDGRDSSRRATVRVFDADGAALAVLQDVQLRRVARDALARRDDRWLAPWLYRTAWRTLPAPPALPVPPSGANERHFVILADGGGVADALAAQLGGAQLLCGDALPSGAPASLSLARATDVIDLRLLQATSGAHVAGKVCLTAQALLTSVSPRDRRARLWIVTAGAQAVTGIEAALSPAQAAAWGVARTLRREHPELRCVCIDLDPESPAGSLRALLAQIDADGAEPEVAVRAGERWVSRLVRHRLESPGLVPDAPCRWVPRTGAFDEFTRQPLTRRLPADGEVEIAVHATGLNFRDVLNVLGMYPGARPPLGGECAGVVTAVGANAAQFEVGQRVLAVAADSLASHVIARAAMTRALPPGVGMEEAASFPIAFVTAEYCLLEIGRLRAGESVLVHAGAGGVGMAAIRTAQRVGARVFATAGSTAKRALLHDLGVAQVFDSRSPAFADQVLAASGGLGVDLVLNSLSREMLDASFRAVARGGRFVEIGKRGIKTPDEVAALGRDIAYTIVDWSDPTRTEPRVIESVLDRVVDALGAGRMVPLPRHVFAIDEAPRAFRLMAAGRHVGRIVLRHPRPATSAAAGSAVRREGTYLVTGGLSGLGLMVARWLGESGAGRLVLIGRRGATGEAASVIARLRAAGTTVLTEALDVSDEAALAALLMRLRREGPPLRGVFHAAAVLENAAILNQSTAHCAHVAAPKLGGAEALDRLTRADPLDFLVLFSSVAGLLGAPGQANYAAANLALDLVAARRQGDGLPALAISWGALRDTGLSADARTATWITEQGLGTLTPTQCLRALERLLGEDLTTIAVADFDWPAYIARAAAGRTPEFLAEITGSAAVQAPRAAAVTDARAGAVAPFHERLAAAPAAGRRALLESFVRERVGHALGSDPSRAIDEHLPLGDLGLDSLLAIELRNTLSAALGRPLPATLLFDHPSIAQLVRVLSLDESGTQAEATRIRSVAPPAPTIAGAEAARRPEAIAIIGMSCRFPGADSPDAFWRLLEEGRTAIREVPAERWDSDALFDADCDAPGRIAMQAGGFLDDVAGFDAAFFGIAPREAASMDPQQRLLLELAWEALENACVPPDQLANTATGVFVGQCNADYLQRLLRRGDAAIDGYLASGTSPSVTSGRLAYCLGLRGPALTVDTSCSSSLVALHLACRSLRAGETRVALAAGVNLMCAPEAGIAMSKAHMLAPDGRSKAFDAAADGLGRGEGIAVVVLKRLSDARADGDPVLALVRGSAMNQDGRSAGLTVPNGPAQEAVIAAALADAGVSSQAIGYVEAHGTGTSLGDPIEVRALSNALGAGRSAAQKLIIGSVKSNIGHLEGAAGLAGVIKTVLCLQRGRLVPQPLFRNPSPHIDWDNIPVAVGVDAGAWPTGAPRLAGVSSFGFSGTNAHAVLEQADADGAPAGAGAAAHLPVGCLVLSARSPASLRALALRYAVLLEQGALFTDVAYCAAVGRTHLALRVAIVTHSGAAAVDALKAFAAGDAHGAHGALLLDSSQADGLHRAPVWVAPDVDPRALLIGREWYAASAEFRDVIDRADRFLGPDETGRRLCATLWEPQGMHEPGRARAAHVAVQCATVMLWRSFGIEPAAIHGDGVGRLSAACLEGRLELEEALRCAAQGAEVPRNATPAPRDATPARWEGHPIIVIGARAPGGDVWQALARVLGECYVAGAAVNWRALGDGGRGRIRLPNYPFDHRRYWVDIARPAANLATEDAGLFYEVKWKALSVVSPAAPALVSPAQFMPSVTRTFDALLSQHDLRTYDQLAPLLDRLSTIHVATALRALGFDDTPCRVFAVPEEALRLRIVPRHRRLFTRMMDFLLADAVLRRVDAGLEILHRLPTEPAQGVYDSVADTFGTASGALRILRRCGNDLAGVLTGARDPLTLLFPDGSFAEANLLYVESPAARVYNGALGAAAVAAIGRLPPGSRLRVLEIGAGTGGTTHTLLPLLPADRVEYTFTDVSPLFLERAVERFPDIRTGLLDIEREPAAQGFARGAYDLMIAANVLHATADLAQTLRHVRGLLAPGGLLLCLEAVAAERWSDLAFGMTEGWWRFSDSALRPAHALLGVDAWCALLARTGLTEVHTIGGEPGAMVGRAQQALLIARAPAAARRFTLVGDADGMAAPLAARLRARGDDVRVLDLDDETAAFEGGDLVYLGALRLDERTTAAACGELACAAPIRWLARFGREPAARPGRAWLVTVGAQPVHGRVMPAGRFQAPLWGVGRVFALEQPRHWGGLVDLCPEDPPGARLDALLGVVDGFGEEDQIAWRNGRAFMPRLERSRGPARHRSVTLDPDATYLIVGGFGGLGLLVARWLAEQGARTIALLGRHPDMSSAGVAAIRDAGARVIPLAGDVADAAALRALLEGLALEAPPLKGIVHAATAVSVVPIAQLTAPQVVSMLQPKIDGLLALETLAPAVDFTVLFSSTASLTGAMGMAHYAAANAFLDASAQRGEGRVLAVNWGSWELVRAASEAGRAGLREGGLNALSTAQALDAMGRLMATGVRQMAVADIDWAKLKPLYERSRARPLLANLGTVQGAEPQPTANNEGVSPTGMPGAAADTTARAMLLDLIAPLSIEDRAEFLEGWVREAVAGTLGWTDPESVPLDTGLFDLGMDSLMAVSLQRKLEQGSGRKLPVTLTFNHPNSRALARFLATVLGGTGRDPMADPAPGVGPATPAAASRDAEIDAMSDAEVEENLRARLAGVG